jgi:hypothetical protein
LGESISVLKSGIKTIPRAKAAEVKEHLPKPVEKSIASPAPDYKEETVELEMAFNK